MARQSHTGNARRHKSQAVGKKQPPVWSSYGTAFPSKRSEMGSLKLQMAGASKSWKLNPSTFASLQ